jgi:hypothetical protein
MDRVYGPGPTEADELPGVMNGPDPSERKIGVKSPHTFADRYTRVNSFGETFIRKLPGSVRYRDLGIPKTNRNP